MRMSQKLTLAIVLLILLAACSTAGLTLPVIAQALPPDASAWFGITNSLTVTTQDDTIASGTYHATAQYGFSVGNMDDDSDTVLGELTYYVKADDIGWISLEKYAERSETLVTWTFPPEFDLVEGDSLWAGYDTNYLETIDVPTSLGRHIDKTLFDADGYQHAEFTVTFDDIDFESAFVQIIADEYDQVEEVDAFLLVDTFSTDMPYSSMFKKDEHKIYVTISPSDIQPGVEYSFSVDIRVELTGAEAPPVMYKPFFGVGLESAYDRTDTATGKEVVMPDNMLPEHMHYASVSTNVSNTWYLSRSNTIGIMLLQVSKPAPAPTPTPSPTPTPTAVSRSSDGDPYWVYWVPFVEEEVTGRSETHNYVFLMAVEDNTHIALDFDHDGGVDHAVDLNAGGIFLIEGIHNSSQMDISGLVPGTCIMSNHPLAAYYAFTFSDWGAYQDGTLTYPLPTRDAMGGEFWLPFDATKAAVIAAEGGTQVYVDTDGDGSPEHTFTLASGEVRTIENLPEGTHLTASGSIGVVAVVHGVGYYDNTHALTLLPTTLWHASYVVPARHPYGGGYQSPSDLSRLLIVPKQNGTTISVNGDSYIGNQGETLTVNLVGEAQVESSAPVYAVYLFDVIATDPWHSSVRRHYTYAHNVPNPLLVVDKAVVEFSPISSHGGPINRVSIVSFASNNTVALDVGADGTVDRTLEMAKGDVIYMDETDPLLESSNRTLIITSSQGAIAITRSGIHWWSGRADGASAIDYLPGSQAPTPHEDRSFTGSVPLPSEVSTDPEVIGTNALYALILVLVLYFAATLFNSTIRENYEIIQGWLSRASSRLRFTGDSIKKRMSGLPGTGARGTRYLQALGMVVVCALLYSFLDPYFTHGLGGFALFISLALAIGIVTYGYEGTQVLLSTYRFGVPAGVKIFPIAIAVAAVFVIISRAIDFHPGLIYGFVGAYALLSAARLDKRQHAIAVLLGTGVLLVLIVAAFFLRIPIPEEARAGESFWLSVADGMLVGIFVIGLEGLLFALVPLTFMDGAKVTAWRRWIWLAVFALVAFLFYHIIINEDGRLAEAAGDMEVVMMFWLMGLFAVLSGMTWVYFRWRRKTLPELAVEEQPPAFPEELGEPGEHPPEEEEGKPTLMVPKEDGEWAEPVTEEDTENQTSVSPEEAEQRDG